MKYIVTHAGKAHRDEFIAICLLLAEFQIKNIYRRDPTEEEICDEKILVVDVGGQLDYEKNNFDHHQAKNMDCALVHVLKALNIFEDAVITFKWLQVTNDLDTKGPFVTAKTLGIDFDTLLSVLSPIEEQILSMFEKNEVVPQPLIDLMRKIGEGLLEQINFNKRRMGELKALASKVEVGGLVGILSPIKDRPSALLDEYRRKFVPDAAFSICPDDRGPGWTLYRFNDNPRIDFSKLDRVPGVIFAHKGGFIAKTSFMEKDEILQIVRKGVIV